MSTRLIHGDCREVLKSLPAESVHCVVTSPPYFGLRDYGTAKWEGGDPECEHVFDRTMGMRASTLGGGKASQPQASVYRDCPKCCARRIDSQVGLEPTPDAYVAELVGVFREVRRVLRKDGTVWLNLGDSYASNGAKQTGRNDGGRPEKGRGWAEYEIQRTVVGSTPGLKPKDLCMIPARVALALQADGWWLRSSIIWHKPNPMPESVTDRPTSAHENIFLLTKSASYFYDREAVAEKSVIGEGTIRNITPRHKNVASTRNDGDRFGVVNDGTRNLRNVWTVASQAFPGSHFATFPPKLIEPCILAGTSERGCCPHCGAGWVREIEVESRPNAPSCNGKYDGIGKHRTVSGGVSNDARARIARGWSPSCSCPAHTPIPATVLDCFAGAGTTGLVADRLGRNAILIELNPAYSRMTSDRLVKDAGMFASIEMQAAE